MISKGASIIVISKAIVPTSAQSVMYAIIIDHSSAMYVYVEPHNSVFPTR